MLKIYILKFIKNLSFLTPSPSVAAGDWENRSLALDKFIISLSLDFPLGYIYIYTHTHTHTHTVSKCTLWTFSEKMQTKYFVECLAKKEIIIIIIITIIIIFIKGFNHITTLRSGMVIIIPIWRTETLRDSERQRHLPTVSLQAVAGPHFQLSTLILKHRHSTHLTIFPRLLSNASTQ